MLPSGELDIEQREDVVVVRLLGEHDLATAPALSDRLRALAREGFGVVVDISDTDFMDVAVVRALLEADDALQAQSRRLVLCFGTPCVVKRVLDLIGAETMFVCSEDRERAIALAGATNLPGGSL